VKRAAAEPIEALCDSARMVVKLQRELEEKEELLVGVRRTVRDVANDRYPILEERDAGELCRGLGERICMY
jgi:hypothetical protein